MSIKHLAITTAVVIAAIVVLKKTSFAASLGL